jgi:hypothetical protein
MMWFTYEEKEKKKKINNNSISSVQSSPEEGNVGSLQLYLSLSPAAARAKSKLECPSQTDLNLELRPLALNRSPFDLETLPWLVQD